MPRWVHRYMYMQRVGGGIRSRDAMTKQLHLQVGSPGCQA